MHRLHLHNPAAFAEPMIPISIPCQETLLVGLPAGISSRISPYPSLTAGIPTAFLNVTIFPFLYICYKLYLLIPPSALHPILPLLLHNLYDSFPLATLLEY